MIEKYFMLGVRFKWACPGANSGLSKDGSIIDNPQQGANPPLVYDGLDGELYNLAAPHVSTVGLTMRMNIPYSWLVYAHGHTTRLHLNADVLTGPMSGCLITVWTDQGRCYVGHVGTVEYSETINKKVKETFIAVMPQNTTGFNPAHAWNPGEISPKMSKFKKVFGQLPPVAKIMALVTSDNRFYSILMFGLKGGQSNEWCVGGIKKVPPMNYQRIKNELKGLTLGKYRF